MKIYYYLFFFIVSSISLTVIAQKSISNDEIKYSVDLAFNEIAIKDSLYFENELKQEFFKRYLSFYRKDSSGGIEDKEAFLKPEIIKSYINEFLISPTIYQPQSQSQKEFNQQINKRNRILDKYALLLFQSNHLDSNAKLFLNSKFICYVKKAKNGIRVHSKKKYIMSLKSNTQTYCELLIKLDKQEERIIECALNE